MFLQNKLAGAVGDITLCISRFREAWECLNTTPYGRIQVATGLSRILMSQLKWEDSYLILREAVHLMPVVNTRTLEHSSKEHVIGEFTDLTSMAVAAVLNAGEEPYQALQLLEIGRGVISSILMDMREDLFELKQRHPDLAAEFQRLRNELDTPELTIQSPVDNRALELQTKRRREADNAFNDLVAKIQVQPGFHNFLLPPMEEEMRAAAESGPL